MRAALVALVALLASGCAELPDVPEGCGNRVIEPGLDEECDGEAGCGGPGTASACGWVCEGELTCPPGYLCGGADQRCRLPTETFAAPTLQTAGASGVTAQDMDGDGAIDLLGYDSRGLLIRWGDWDGALAAQTRVGLPVSVAASGFLDADDDQRLDVVMPLAMGLAMFTSDGGRGLIPAPQIAMALPAPGGGEPCERLVIGGLRSSLERPRLLVAIGGRSLAFIDNPEGCAASPADCEIAAGGGELVGDRLAVAPLGYAAVGSDQQVAGALYGSREVAVWGEDPSGIRPTRLGEWSMSVPIGLTGHVWFGRMNNDDCYDLVVDTGSTIEIVYAKAAGGVCDGLNDTVTLYDRPLGTMLAVGDIDGDPDGRDELIHTIDIGPAIGGMGASRPGVAPALITEPIGLDTAAPRHVAVLDYNHDGWGDLAITVVGGTTLDFYLNDQGKTFNRFPVDVGGVPQVPEVGDYDGDLHDDVAIAVADAINPDGRDSLLIFYGDPTGRPPGQLVGQFEPRARPIQFSGGLQPGTDSLLVTSNPPLDPPGAACDRRMSVLIGDTTRQMFSPFILLDEQSPSDPEPVTSMGLVDVTPAGGAPQLFGFGAVSPDLGIEPTETVISLLGFDNTALTLADQFIVPVAPLALYGAIVRSGTLDADLTPEVIAIAGDRAAVVSLTDQDAEISPIAVELQRPPWLDLIDMDLDDDLDVIGAGGAAVIGDDNTGGPAASRFWIAWNDGGAVDFAGATVLELPDDLSCFDADVIRSSTTGIPQLVAVCYRPDPAEPTRSEALIVIASYLPEDSTSEPVELRMIALERQPYGLEVADFTGDGLDDIAVSAATTVTLYRQCRTDDVGACTPPAAFP